MPGQAVIHATDTVEDSTIVDGDETVVARLTNVATDANYNAVRIVGTATITPGTDTSTVVARLYRGVPVDGVQLGVDFTIVEFVTDEPASVSFMASDAPPYGSYEYTLTVQTVDQSAGSTCDYVLITAFVGG